MDSPRISVVVTTFDAPDMLHLTLLALGRQALPPAEVLVADDGSGPATAAALVALAGRLPFPLVHVWQPHAGFRAARSRNNAIFRAREEWIAFLDQDTLPHRDWLAVHAAHLRPDGLNLGHLLPLPETAGPGYTAADVESGRFETLHGAAALRVLDRRQRRDAWYAWLRRLGCGIKAKPRLRSCNAALARAALRRVNGFDEDYVGWGQEDDDLGRRLYLAGLRPCVLVNRARVSHLPHPLRRPPDWRAGANVARYRQPLREAACAHGLTQHPHPDVQATPLSATR